MVYSECKNVISNEEYVKKSNGAKLMLVCTFQYKEIPTHGKQTITLEVIMGKLS